MASNGEWLKLACQVQHVRRGKSQSSNFNSSTDVHW